MTRRTRNALLGIAGILTAGLVPWLWRRCNPRPARRPKLSTVLERVTVDDVTAREWAEWSELAA